MREMTFDTTVKMSPKSTEYTTSSNSHPPEKKPYKIAKTIAPAGVVAPHIAKMRPPEMKHTGTKVLNWPNISARALGTTRPIIEPAFKIASYNNK